MFGNMLAKFGEFATRIGGMLGDVTGGGTTNDPDPQDLVTPLMNAIWDITWPILTALLALGGIFAIWLGVRLAMAQDESKRKEAKAQLIWAIIAIVIIALMLGVFGAVREFNR